MNDHRPGHGRGCSDQQRRKVLFDPGDRAPVRLFGACEIVEDRDRRYRVVRRIDDIIAHETLDIADDRDGALLDPACQFLGHAGLCFALTNGGVHGDSSFTGGSSRPPNITPSAAAVPSNIARSSNPRDAIVLQHTLTEMELDASWSGHKAG